MDAKNINDQPEKNQHILFKLFIKHYGEGRN